MLATAVKPIGGKRVVMPLLAVPDGTVAMVGCAYCDVRGGKLQARLGEYVAIPIGLADIFSCWMSVVDVEITVVDRTSIRADRWRLCNTGLFYDYKPILPIADIYFTYDDDYGLIYHRGATQDLMTIAHVKTFIALSMTVNAPHLIY
jgi:hypothetical protein